MAPEQRTIVVLLVVVTLVVALTYLCDRRRPPGRFTRWSVRASEMLAHDYQQRADDKRARGHTRQAARDERRSHRCASRAATIRDDYERYGHTIH